jgi:hypothetical protein
MLSGRRRRATQDQKDNDMYKIIGADGKEYGPIPAEQLRQWIAEGRVNAQTKVLPEGALEWKTIRDLPEFAASLPAPAPMAPISLAPPTSGPTTNGLAITGMILGILSMATACCCYGLPFNLGGIICSSIALSQIKNNPNQQGRGMAIAGLILSLLSIALAVLMALLVGTGEIWKKLQEMK